MLSGVTNLKTDKHIKGEFSRIASDLDGENEKRDTQRLKMQLSQAYESLPETMSSDSKRLLKLSGSAATHEPSGVESE
jgi:hypothetical protein